MDAGVAQSARVDAILRTIGHLMAAAKQEDVEVEEKESGDSPPGGGALA